ncbi:hypothetical protein [Microvirga sp. VF16]|uniref:hypothetical protein n=1 Tax=Microvirga sp. VF16 TaxID=2807101 RepID=UPI00193EAFE1|nr:hypothetical protein [Microvirga sp. VF16]
MDLNPLVLRTNGHGHDACARGRYRHPRSLPEVQNPGAIRIVEPKLGKQIAAGNRIRGKDIEPEELSGGGPL